MQPSSRLNPDSLTLLLFAALCGKPSRDEETPNYVVRIDVVASLANRILCFVLLTPGHVFPAPLTL